MKARELLEILQDLDAEELEMPVFVSADSEGNDFNHLYSVDVDTQDSVLDNNSDELCLVLWP